MTSSAAAAAFEIQNLLRFRRKKPGPAPGFCFVCSSGPVFRSVRAVLKTICLPFHKLTQSFSLLTREERDISPEENEGLNVLPQALTRDPAQLAAWYTTLYEGWKDRFGATIVLGRIRKLME